MRETEYGNGNPYKPSITFEKDGKRITEYFSSPYLARKTLQRMRRSKKVVIIWTTEVS